MNAPAILFAHERPSVARAVEAVLSLHGFSVTVARDAAAVERRLASQRWASLVVDVALPGAAAYELIERAKNMAAPDADQGAESVVLVASVYRKTSYKRRPARLYGADDYVEVHHLGDMLPDKLRRLTQAASPVPEAQRRKGAEDQVSEVLRVEGDSRLATSDLDRLASMIVADMVLYNGDRIAVASDLASIREAVAEDLEIARELLLEVARVRGGPDLQADPVGQAFDRLMVAMGRREGSP